MAEPIGTSTSDSELLDIYALARVNGDNLRDRYVTTRERVGDAADLLQRFCERVQREGRMTINTKSRRLLWMLRNGFYPNPHDEARERARLKGGDSEEYLREQQGDYYHRRVTFERSFVDGERFRYAALNIGGAGLSYYGLYCLVIRSPEQADPVALLPANSLERFMTDEGALDESLLRREVAPWPHRHHLTACKHSHEVADIPEISWPEMMCHTTATDQGFVDSFVEIIVGMSVTPPGIVEIRADGQRIDELWDKLASDTLTDSERTELNHLTQVFEALANHGLDTLYRQV